MNATGSAMMVSVSSSRMRNPITTHAHAHADRVVCVFSSNEMMNAIIHESKPAR